MLPSRGLRPAQFIPIASRQPAIIQSNVSRKFSSLPRITRLSAVPCRTSPLQSARWRTGATGNSNVVLTVSSVRYGSWYAPWSWGNSSTSTGSDFASHHPVAQPSTQPASEFVQHAEPVVTTATPELAPAGIDKAAIVNSTSTTASPTAESASTYSDPKTLDELLGYDPTKVDTIPKVEFDPTQLVDHAGHLKELGLDYGWGMTTMFQKTIEQIYLSSGWGWAGSIMAAGVVVRCATFFFQALSSDKMAAMASLKPVTQPLQEKMEAAIARGDKQQADLYKMQQAEIMKPYMGGFLSMGGFMIVQGWIGISAFRFLRAMSELPAPGMVNDGWLWFSDLTVRDPYFILPAVTSAIMYAVFKTGGETGIQNDVGQAAQRQKMFTGLAVVLGLVTAFQASGLQLYFLMSGIMGGMTGWLLRQNGFRRMIGIRTLPSPESNALYSKVANGELKLKDIKGSDGKIRYKAPTPVVKPAKRRNATTISGINVKSGAAIPAHLKPEAPKIDMERPDRDVDYEEGAQGKALSQKLDYYRRNYRLSYMWRRFSASVEGMGRKAGYGGPKTTKEQEKRKRRAEEYEIERRRRFENRK